MSVVGIDICVYIDGCQWKDNMELHTSCCESQKREAYVPQLDILGVV
ncbi:hypothetical protein [Nostoc sp. MG11]|nr:hypothetical protein [Nostoc sp. MG11]